MNAVEIRASRADDFAAMQGVFRRASLSNEGDRATLLAHPAALVLSEELPASGRGRVAVAADGTIVGFASARRTYVATLELDDLFVEPSCMRQGIASALVRDIAAHAATDGVTRIEVTANEHAHGFYRAAGFVPDGVADTEFGPGLRMHLDVDVDVDAGSGRGVEQAPPVLQELDQLG